MTAVSDIQEILSEGLVLHFPVVPKASRHARVRVPSSISDGSPMADQRTTDRRPTDFASSRARFETAVRPVLPRLYRFCVALSGDMDAADDLFQNTLIKAYLNAASFEGRSDLVVWICGIARHEHLEAQRTDARRRGIFERFVDACASALGLGPEAEERLSPETRVMGKENVGLLLACLQKLPEEFRAVVVLCDIEELGYDRAAEILGIPKGTVKSRHARGRARLREAYEKLDRIPSVTSAMEEEPT
jgi:RNA polymerase sigma-70 factor, ECF subfamily